MTDTEKINLIDALEGRETSEEHFALLYQFSYDPDAFVRSRSAAVLKGYSGNETLRTLLRLANDEDAFVRTEAYDSLSKFPCRETELLLRHSIYPEDDELAARYAILSWTDVTAALHGEYGEQTEFVQKMLTDAEFSGCLAECNYALCKFGQPGALEMLLSLLKHEDYIIRCTVCNLCMELADANNAKTIRDAVAALLQTEKTPAVRLTAYVLLQFLIGLYRKEVTT